MLKPGLCSRCALHLGSVPPSLSPFPRRTPLLLDTIVTRRLFLIPSKVVKCPFSAFIRPGQSARELVGGGAGGVSLVSDKPERPLHPSNCVSSRASIAQWDRGQNNVPSEAETLC